MDEAAARDLAPTGILRVAINTGNPVLAKKPVDGGEPGGPSVEIARELARRLSLPLAFIIYDTAGQVVEAAGKGAWDVGFLAIDPLRAETICFSQAYVRIEGTYLVRDNAPFKSCADLDQPGVRIAVEANAAYDLYLKRTLKHAEIVHAPTPGASFGLFHDQQLDALAGVRQGLDRIAADVVGFRVLADRFMAIEQAMTTPVGREAGAAFIETFIADLKASGFVRHALDMHGQHDAVVA